MYAVSSRILNLEVPAKTLKTSTYILASYLNSDDLFLPDLQ